VGCGGPATGIAEWYAAHGFKLVIQGRHDEAIAEYNKGIELDPNLATAYHNRAFTYNDIGRLDQAIADCNRAIELDPQRAIAYLNKA